MYKLLFLVLFPAVGLASDFSKEVAEGDFDPHLHCITEAILNEGVGEPLAGQAAIAMVIKERTELDEYPSTPCGVIKQVKKVYGKKICQFSYRCGRIKTFSEERYNLAMSIANCVWDGDCVVEKVEGASLYYACSGPSAIPRPSWDFSKLRSLGKVGHHCFFQQV